MLLEKLSSALTLLLLYALPVAASPRQHPMTVCEFVRNVKTLEGQIVSVRGTAVMHESNPEGSTPDFLVADCAALKKVRTVIVKVAYPDVWFLKRPPKDYHPDPESFRRASIIIKAGFKQGRLKDRYVAIVGQAFAPPPPSLPPPGLHVTPEGTYDAGITIQGIYNVKIPPNEP